MSRIVVVVAVLCCGVTRQGFPQFTPAGTGGIEALDRHLRRLAHHKRVLLIGAHPDDEDTELLTVLARGQGAQAAYLAMNRGEGGQNGIGPELGVELGIVRSGELSAARQIDGARQFFTRAFDFGYTRSVEETFRFWPRDSLLKDLVRVIRQFRPQIVVTTFVGAPREGHGQHRVAGILALEAFRAAGDSSRFPELLADEGLPPHQPHKLYRTTRFDTSATSLTLDGGAFDPVAGKSYHQLAMASRSMHRSQDFGLLEEPGPSAVRLGLLEDRTGAGTGGLFAGVDTSLAALASRPTAARLEDFRRAVDSARALFHPERLSEVARLLARADAILDAIEVPAQPPDLRVPLLEQRELVARALTIAAGVVVDAVAEREVLVTGEAFAVEVSVWNAGETPVVVREVSVPDPGSSPRVPALEGVADTVQPGAVVKRQHTVRVPARFPITRPYFLEQPPLDAMYRWPEPKRGRWGEPFEPPPVEARVEVEVLGRRVRRAREVVYRFRDQAVGEVRRPLHVVPRIGVALEPAQLLWPAGSPERRTFTVTLTSHDSTPAQGTVELELPPGWAQVDAQAFSLGGLGAQEAYRFDVAAPSGTRPGSYRVAAVARTADGVAHRESAITIDYPHLRPRFLADSAVATVRIAPLVLPPVSQVGYVRGASDRVPEALRAVGIPLTLLDGDDLRRGDLDAFDAIVVGSRAYEINAALVESNGRLVDYARRGGLLVVQYQQYQFVRGGYAPYPVAIAFPHDRVTDETAPATLLEPGHRVLQGPNPIGAADWEGWVQERGLYFPHTWDPAYQSPVAFADPGDEPKAGGLLIATVGQGTYVLTSLSFFRQLPAGVPGAFRLFANILALR